MSQAFRFLFLKTLLDSRKSRWPMSCPERGMNEWQGCAEVDGFVSMGFSTIQSTGEQPCRPSSLTANVPGGGGLPTLQWVLWAIARLQCWGSLLLDIFKPVLLFKLSARSSLPSQPMRGRAERTPIRNGPISLQGLARVSVYWLDWVVNCRRAICRLSYRLRSL